MAGDPPMVRRDYLHADYTDITTFGSTKKEYLLTLPNTMTPNEVRTYRDTWNKSALQTFDYARARDLYKDDPVVLAILDRMEILER